MVHGQKRPFYVIARAHDSASLVEEIEAGANAILTDIYFDTRGFPKTTTITTIISKGAPLSHYLEFLGNHLNNRKHS